MFFEGPTKSDCGNRSMCFPRTVAQSQENKFMIITRGNEVAGCNITHYLGVVRGIVVRSPNLAQGLFGGLKQMIGGNIESFAQGCESAREEAFQRMGQHAEERRADAIIAMRYDATEFSDGATEVLAYGTAVKFAK